MLETIVGIIGTAVVGAIGGGIKWGVALQKRVEVTEAISEAHREDIIRRLDRIERKIDANGKTSQ